MSPISRHAVRRIITYSLSHRWPELCSSVAPRLSNRRASSSDPQCSFAKRDSHDTPAPPNARNSHVALSTCSSLCASNKTPECVAAKPWLSG